MLMIRSLCRPQGLIAVLPDRRQSLFALCNLLAAALGLLVSFEASLPRPWFTLLTVYVTAQSLVGSVRPKLIHRLAGLLLGAAVTVLTVPNMQNAPALLVLVLAGWSGLCVYLGLLQRTPRAVFFQMAAFGATVISLPFIYDPGSIFDTTLERVEEAAIGIFCTIAVHQLLRPWDVEASLRRRADAFLHDACTWAAQALGPERLGLENHQRQRLAADIAELGQMAYHLPRRRWPGNVTAGQVAALQQGLADLLPLVATVTGQLDALHAAGACPGDLSELVSAVRQWIDDPTSHTPHDLAAGCHRLSKVDRSEWSAILTASTAQELGKLIIGLQEARALAKLSPDHPAALDSFAMPCDHRIAALAGLAMASAITLYCVLWIVLDWPNGATMAAFAAIMTGSFALADDPAPAIARYLRDTLKTYPLAAFYLFFVLPRIDGYVMLITAIAPVLLWMGYIQSDPRHGPRALPMFSCFIVALNLQPRFANDFDVFANTACAQIAGIVTTLVVTRLFRSVEGRWTARNLMRTNSEDLAALCDLRRPLRSVRWSAHAFDRLGQVAQRMAQAAEGERLEQADGLVDLQVGPQLIALRRSLSSLPFGSRRQLGAVLALAGIYYRTRWDRQGSLEAPVNLLEEIDRAVPHIAALGPSQVRHAALCSLASLRCALFPEASAMGGAA